MEFTALCIHIVLIYLISEDEETFFVSEFDNLLNILLGKDLTYVQLNQ